MSHQSFSSQRFSNAARKKLVGFDHNRITNQGLTIQLVQELVLTEPLCYFRLVPTLSIAIHPRMSQLSNFSLSAGT